MSWEALVSLSAFHLSLLTLTCLVFTLGARTCLPSRMGFSFISCLVHRGSRQQRNKD